MFARGARTEPGSGDENGGTDVVLIIEDEFGVITPFAEEPASETGALYSLQPVRRDDLVGVDIRALKWHGATFEDSN
jgi:hypothetical protein